MGLAVGDLAVVVGAAVAVPVAYLGDRGHVDGVVDPPVAAQRQPVHLLVPRRHFDRGGAVAGGEVIPAGEPGDVPGIADDGVGDDGADAEDLSQRGVARLDRCGQLLPGLAQLGIEVAQVLQELAGELVAGLGDGASRRDLLQDAGGLACADLLAEAAGDQLAEHRVEPAGDLVAGPGQVTVPLGPHLQHRGVVLGCHFPPGPGTQRRDRDGQGVVGVVLVRVPGLQQPHPGGQLGRHVQHPLPGSDQLLGQQMPQPTSAFHGPGPLRPGRGPGHQLLRLGRGRADPQLAQRLFACPDRHRGMRALMRVHADHHCHQHTPRSSPRGMAEPQRACLIPDLLALAPLSSHATARPGRLAPRSKARPHAVGRRFGSQPTGPLERYGTTAAPSGSIRRLRVRSAPEAHHPG